MKIAVAGLWHLGCVTAASCAKHFDVCALDADAANIAALRERMANDVGAEVFIAAREQREITRLRLEKLLMALKGHRTFFAQPVLHEAPHHRATLEARDSALSAVIPCPGRR